MIKQQIKNTPEKTKLKQSTHKIDSKYQKKWKLITLWIKLKKMKNNQKGKMNKNPKQHFKQNLNRYPDQNKRKNSTKSNKR